MSWLRGYEWTLDKVLKYKFVTLLVTFATMAGTVYLYVVIPKGFFPVEDTGFISVTVEGPADISFRAMRERQNAIADIIRQDPAVAYVNSTVGVGGPNATNNTGRMFVGLKPKAERGPSGPVLQRLRRTTGERRRHGGLLPRNPEHQSRRTHRQGRVPVHDAVERDRDALSRVRRDAATRSRKSPACATSTAISTSRTRRSRSRSTARRRRSTASRSIRSARSSTTPSATARSRRSTRRSTTTRSFWRRGRTSRPTPAGLSKIYLKTSLANTTAAVTTGGGVLGTGTPNGMSIPLSAVTRLVPTVGPLQVNHQGQQPSVTISFNLAPGTSLGQAVDAIQQDRARVATCRSRSRPASRATRRCSRSR